MAEATDLGSFHLDAVAPLLRAQEFTRDEWLAIVRLFRPDTDEDLDRYWEARWLSQRQ